MNADHRIKVPTGEDDRQKVLHYFNNDLGHTYNYYWKIVYMMVMGEREDNDEDRDVSGIHAACFLKHSNKEQNYACSNSDGRLGQQNERPLHGQ